jgi:hypothetical protein
VFQRVLLSLCCGAVLEVVALLIFLKQSLIESRSIVRTLVEWTQAPSWEVSKLVYHFIVPPVPLATVIAVLTVLFLMQTAILALPVWLLMRRWPESPN